MIRETKQRIVRTIETEVHDKEDSLPLSKNQRNIQKKRHKGIWKEFGLQDGRLPVLT